MSEPPVEGLARPLTALVARSLENLEGELRSPVTRTEVATLIAGLRDPLRIAVAGRIKAGKSTLVNALLHQRVAPTAVGECTKIVTWYHHGDQERAEAVLRSGGRRSFALQPDGSLPPTPPIDTDEIERLEVHLSIEALRGLVIIDTPGLMSTDDESSRATRDLLSIDRASRRAMTQADVLLLVMAMEPRHDDLDVLSSFDAHFRGLSHHALNAIAVLSRIDHSGLDAPAVVQRARELARELHEHHRVELAAVVPVVGLIGETVNCGVLTESDVRVLGALAQWPAENRQKLLRSAGRFTAEISTGATALPDVSRLERLQVLERLDLYGIEQALSAIDDGDREGPALSKRLFALSGMASLEGQVFGRLRHKADEIKAAWALAGIARLSSEQASDRSLLAACGEQLALDPALRTVQLVRAVQRQAAGLLSLPDDLVVSLLRLASAPSGPTAAGSIDGDTKVTDEIRTWRHFANTGRAGPAERAVAETVCRLLEASL